MTATPIPPHTPRALFEPLEPRRLFSLVLQNLEPPPPSGDPPHSPALSPVVDLAATSDGSVWYSANQFGSGYVSIIQIDPSGHATNHNQAGFEIEDCGPVAP